MAEKRKIRRVTDVAGNTVQIYPETSAEAVLYQKQIDGSSVDNVKDALDKLSEGTGVNDAKNGSGQSLVTDHVATITPSAIGAESSGAVSTHNSSTTAHSDIRTAVTNAQNKANSAYSLAEGRAKAVSFDTVAIMTTALKAAAKADYKVGDNIFIKALDTTDYWISKVLDTNTGTYGYFELSALETQKVDLTPCVPKTTEINGKPLSGDITLDKSDIGLSNVDNTKDADKNVANSVKLNGKDASYYLDYNNQTNKPSLSRTESGSGGFVKDVTVDGHKIIVTKGDLPDSGVGAGAYSAVTVDAKGRVTAGGKSIEFGTSGQTTPSNDLMVNGLFLELVEA